MLPEAIGADGSADWGGWMLTVTELGAEDLRWQGPMRMTERVLSLPESVSNAEALAVEEEEEPEEEEEEEEPEEEELDRFWSRRVS